MKVFNPYLPDWRCEGTMAAIIFSTHWPEAPSPGRSMWLDKEMPAIREEMERRRGNV